MRVNLVTFLFFFPAQMALTQITIYKMRAVGMHHWGQRSLDLTEKYSVKWEPECSFDPGNAMAIYDSQHNKRAYITREDAKILSTIMSKGYPCGKMMALQAKTSAHCVQQKLGPQHECTIWFKSMKSLETIVAWHQSFQVNITTWFSD